MVSRVMARRIMRRDVVSMQTTTLIQRKAATYRTFTEWLGGKAATIGGEGKPTVLVDKGVWTPEDLFIAAIETCLLMSFATIVDKEALRVDAYYSESVGLLEFAEGRDQFTRVIVRPTIVVADDATIEPALKAIQQAQRNCLVANSLLTTVIVEPDIRLRHAA